MVLLHIGDDAIQALSWSVETASDSQFEALGAAAVSVVLGLEREDTALVGPEFEEMDVDFIKRTYSALVCLFLEAAKNDLSQTEVGLFLRSECGFGEAQGDLLARLFLGKKDELRGLLSQTANHSYLPQLEGVEWRLEYCVPAPDNPSVRELLYKVCLKTVNREEGREDKLEFIASVEELQDLVSRLKDACKSVERAVQR
ncbi:hypothetical protein R1flu_019209 [Riccia fluitans]|uniref:COMM domain-containing protein 3 n=1 Tax=Riccia fluitans TaxID=41844 RepID=A0ABD1ZK83_9MARC